ncbi:MAG: efflux RND transporter periplasmic adaptor subunit, partial [Gemmatimonadota bacterium]
ASGQVEPILVIEVKSKASCEITDMYVETGDAVERGDLLAEVDPRDVRNALAQAEADREVARARLQIAQSQEERSQELRDATVVTQQELESATLEMANARAALTRAETNLELAQERADLHRGQVRTLVDETDIGKVQPGQVARVQVEAFPTRDFVGSVYKIEPQAVVDQNVTMFPVLVRLDNQEGLLKPNMNAEVQVDVAQRRDVVLVPNAAVVSMQDARAAGEVLGMDGDRVREQMMARPAPAPGGNDGAAGTNGSPEATDGGEGEVDCAALMEKVRSGGGPGSLSQEERTQARQCFQQMGGQGPRGGQASGDPDTRPAVVFVATDGGYEARSVILGLNDWDRTQVVSGLEAGEEVVLMSVAQLRQQQEEIMNRIRERSSPIPGGGR